MTAEVSQIADKNLFSLKAYKPPNSILQTIYEGNRPVDSFYKSQCDGKRF